MEQTFSQWYIGAPNGVVLCVNERHGCELSGVFYHSYKTEPTGFMDLGQMTLLMEKFFDELQFPHPGTNERNFFPQNKPYVSHQERTKIMSDEQLLQKHGDIGTFIIRVQHRQNSRYWPVRRHMYRKPWLKKVPISDLFSSRTSAESSRPVSGR